MEIRAYSDEDFSEVLNIIKSNTPAYFAEEEIDEFISYLQDEREHYYVAVIAGEIVGNGGFNHIAEDKIVRISWDMISINSHNQGIGKGLLSFRINKIKELYPNCKIIVRTSQHAYQFYQKGGFNLEKVVKDYWAEGFDLYLMRYKS